MDTTDFFRQATLRICGSLDMDRALQSTLAYLNRFIPGQSMHLFVHRPDQGILASVASAGQPSGLGDDWSLALPRAARDDLARSDAPRLRILDRMADHPIGLPLARALDLADSSAVVMVLRLEQEELGALFLSAPGQARFTNDHAGLLSQLNEPFAIALSNCLRYQEVVELKEQLADDNRYLSGEMRSLAGEEIIGADFGLREVMDRVNEVAPLTSPVLLLGETGTGKELIAGAIHNLSPRRNGPFIKINCGAIPESLIDSELFGHEKGAFTGAVASKRGRFERADQGTIFLDEIGELPPNAQVRLLRVLQEKEIERVGGEKQIKLDIRIIAATHRHLPTMITDNTFREDLYFRLQVFPITIPPLRRRTDDIPVLVQHFIRKKSREMGLAAPPAPAPGALAGLQSYRWPGNVRELENAVERGLITSHDGSIDFHLLPRDPAPVRSGDTSWREPPDGDWSLDRATAAHIHRVLALTRGRVDGPEGAARVLKVNPSTLRHRMRKLGVSFGRRAARTSGGADG